MSALLNNNWRNLIWLIVLVSLSVVVWFTQAQWQPYADKSWRIILNKKPEVASSDTEAHDADATPDTLTLSPTAWKNIGLMTGSVEPRDFEKIVSVPAMVIERPGHSQHEISAPMTGVITQVYPIERQAVQPGQKMFDLRLTHEDVVTAQTDFLANLQLLDVASKELTRLQEMGEGIVPGKRIIEQTYERDKALSGISTKRQSLLLHGLSEPQIAEMERTRQVLPEITITAPSYADTHEHAAQQHQYFVQAIKVNRGQSVTSGQLLCVLADHCLLYVEGKAFASDAQRLMAAATSGATVEVVPVASGENSNKPLQLKVQSVANEVDQQSRALKFYLLLPNQLVHSATATQQPSEYVAWKYRPGQRMEAKIPTTTIMKNKIVLPPDAVVIDGPNAFVFEQNGDNFDRIDVHVLYRDKDTVVLENDGQLVGSLIAMNGAYQMHLEMKNASGGAMDPHAGHSH